MGVSVKAQTVQRVIERFLYEGLLIHNQYRGRRWRVTLQDVLAAGEIEPRVLELLPGIIVHRPTLMYRFTRDCPQHPDVQQLMQWMAEIPADRMWHGIPVRDMQRAADRIAEIQRHRRRKQHWRNMNIRVSEQDLTRLERLAAQAGRTKSEILRTLIAEAAQK